MRKRYGLNENGQITTPEGHVMTTSLILAHLNQDCVPPESYQKTKVTDSARIPFTEARRILKNRGFLELEQINSWERVFKHPRPRNYNKSVIVLDTIQEEDPVLLTEQEVVLCIKAMSPVQFIDSEWGDDNYFKTLEEAIEA